MLATRTGNFPIGFRQGWTDWQKDVNALVQFAKANQIGVIDVGRDVESAKKVTAGGLKIGSADLKEWGKLMSPDKGERSAAVEANAAWARDMALAGAKNLFLCMLPDKAERSRADNFKDLVESLTALAPQLEKTGSRLCIEGYPGHGAIVCTPEGYRALFKAVPSHAVAINYDPSHLVRMGIDPVRFLSEFASRVAHVHGKDTEVMNDAVYEFGIEQPATFAEAHGFGAWTWRYAIPGHGQVRWGKIFSILKDAKYAGAVSIELEDEHFNGTPEGERTGIIAGAQYLATV